MAMSDDLLSAAENLAAELKAHTAARLAAVQAGAMPPTTYSVNGESLDWNGYLTTVTAQIKALQTAAAEAEEPWEYHQQMFT